MQVSLAQPKRAAAAQPLPLLAAKGARVVLGTRPTLPAAPIAPTPHTLFGPRGACLASPSGPLVVCDTGHHRVLVWLRAPAADDTPADLVIGQPDLFSEGPKALRMPTGVAIEAGVLAVADAWNHRVLLWHRIPERSNAQPDAVLGEGLFWPYGVTLCGGRLFIADTGNRRVLEWNCIPRAGQAPDRIHGDAMHWPHTSAVDGGRLLVADPGINGVHGVPVRETNMPYGVAVSAGKLVVADTANSRLLGYPLHGGAPEWIAGQASLAERGENRWGLPCRDSLCWPYAVSACRDTLVVADTGNNRVLLWDMT